MTLTKRTIIKVQLSLTGAGCVYLMYDKGRTHVLSGTVDDEIRLVMMGRPKAYFHAQFVDGEWQIQGHAPDQEW